MVNKSIVTLLCLVVAGCDTRTPEGSPSHDAATPEQPVATAPPAPAMEPPAAEPRSAFNRTLQLQGITFVLHTQDDSLTVTPVGLEVDNEAVVRTLQGEVTDAAVADLDADGSPEVYIFLRSGPAAQGEAVGYAANKRRSLSAIYLAPLDEDLRNGTGYGGHDTFTVMKDRIIRRFPLMKEDGTPSGKHRDIEYRLSAGEAGWILVAGKVTDSQ